MEDVLLNDNVIIFLFTFVPFPFRLLTLLGTAIALMDLSLAQVPRLRSYQSQPSMAAWAPTHETIISKTRKGMEEIALIQMRSWISFYSMILTKMN
jgi:hypothetical protein